MAKTLGTLMFGDPNMAPIVRSIEQSGSPEGVRSQKAKNISPQAQSSIFRIGYRLSPRLLKYKTDYGSILKIGDTMRTKIIMALLALLAVSFSVAPSWVKSGVSLNYSVGSDLVSFSVLNRTDSNVQIKVFTKSTSHSTYPNENASAQSGQFWFDNSSLSSAYSGQNIGDYEVTDVNTQSFSGKQWDTVTLESTLSGAITTKVLDKKTGLLLKQTVNAVGAPSVILQQFYVPDWVQVPVPPVNNTPPPPPPVNNTGNVTAPPPLNNTVVNSSQNNTPPAQTNTTVEQNTTSPGQAPWPSPPSPADKPFPCCPAAFILLVLMFAVVSRKE